MSIDKLKSILHVVGTRVDIPTIEDWNRFQNTNLVLPADYRDFISEYGSGAINRFIVIYNPFASGKGNDLITAMNETLDAFRVLRDDSSNEYKWKLYPERGGLLPFGATIDGDNLFWVTNGEPDEWCVAVEASRTPSYDIYKDNFSTFLTRMLTEEGYCSTFAVSKSGRLKPYFAAFAFEQ